MDRYCQKVASQINKSFFPSSSFVKSKFQSFKAQLFVLFYCIVAHFCCCFIWELLGLDAVGLFLYSSPRVNSVLHTLACIHKISVTYTIQTPCTYNGENCNHCWIRTDTKIARISAMPPVVQIRLLLRLSVHE